jgi:hypothetical protein
VNFRPLGDCFLWAFLLSEAHPKNALVNLPPQKKDWKQMQTFNFTHARYIFYFYFTKHLCSILHFLQFYNFQASLNHRANACSCFNYRSRPQLGSTFSTVRVKNQFWQKHVLGYTMGDFSENSSGHPGPQSRHEKADFHFSSTAHIDRGRVARFFLIQYTKAGKNRPND